MLLSAAAAGLSWWFATAILGDPLPVFAPIAAVIGMSPGVASRRRQTLGMLAGVVIGILVGSAVRMAGSDALLGVMAATLTSMLLAVSFGLTPVMVIQAGASAIVVVASALPGTAWTRLEDACVGAAIALICAQALFSANPERVLVAAVVALADLGAELDVLPPERRISRLPDGLKAVGRLADALALAADAQRWTVAGYWRRDRIAAAERDGSDPPSRLRPRCCGPARAVTRSAVRWRPTSRAHGTSMVSPGAATGRRGAFGSRPPETSSQIVRAQPCPHANAWIAIHLKTFSD